MNAWRRAWELFTERLPRAEDDRGSLAMAMMAILVGATLGALILPMVISQNKATRFDMTRVHALHAAQTGIDVMLGQIRDTLTTDGNANAVGDPSRLPCPTKDKPVTGSANGSGNGAGLQDRASYSVYVAYWSARPTADGSPMSCLSGYGTYDTSTKTATPRYVVITSTGKDGTVDSGSRGRRVVATYVVQTDDSNFAGGVIQIYPDATGKPWCMDAGPQGVKVDGPMQVFLRACSTSIPPAAQQSFIYRGDLSIQLASSVSKDRPSGLCLDTLPTERGDSIKENVMVLTRCGVANPAKCADVNNCPTPSNQQWAVDDASGAFHRLRGALPDKSGTDGYCVGVTNQRDAIPIGLFRCGVLSDETGSWAVPTRATGPGRAGAATKQLVNYREPGKCVEVPAGNPDNGFLILNPCKQNPNPKLTGESQTFAPDPKLTDAPTNTLLKTTIGSTTYCLNSPLIRGGYPRLLASCPENVQAANPSYVWTVNQAKDSVLGDLPYAQKFTVVDASGQCLSPGPVSAKADPSVRVIVTRCDGSAGQKWNAPANLDTPRITSLFESPPA